MSLDYLVRDENMQKLDIYILTAEIKTESKVVKPLTEDFARSLKKTIRKKYGELR